MNIYMCEDNIFEKERYVSLLEDIIQKNNFMINSIAAFTSADKMIRNITGSQNIYILDIELNRSLSGIALASVIREMDTGAKLIFLTAHKELAIESINSYAEIYSFIVKEEVTDNVSFIHLFQQLLTKIDTQFRENIKRLSNDSNSIILKDRNGVQVVPLNDIQFLENFSEIKKIKFSLKKASFLHNGSLSHLKSSFSHASFYTSSQTYIINMEAIKKVDKKNQTLFFESGEIKYMTKKFMNKFYSRYKSYIYEI